jgi:hypothetical protein
LKLKNAEIKPQSFTNILGSVLTLEFMSLSKSSCDCFRVDENNNKLSDAPRTFDKNSGDNEKDFTFTLRNLDLEDEGKYMCVNKNDHGQYKFPFELKVVNRKQILKKNYIK